MVVIKTGTSTFQASESKLRRPFDTVDLENFRTRVRRAGSIVLWPSLVKVE